MNKRIMAVLCTAILLFSAGCSLANKDVKKTDGVYYEIFVRSFADSDGDGIGDINGITEKLDYLKDLGISGIWLTPFNPSPSYHKYDVTDYYNVDKEYGTIDDFKKLLDEAHKRDISVVMDLVINHTSYDHPWFQEAIKSQNNPYRDYYNWASLENGDINLKSNVWGHRVWNKIGDDYYYALFWDRMPDLNFNNQDVRKEIKDIAKFWIDLGVDGFRCDAAMHIFSPNEEPKGTNVRQLTLDWWSEFKQFCTSENKDFMLIGEVWTDTKGIAPYYESFDMLFNFRTGEDIITLLNVGKEVGELNETVDSIEKIYNTYGSTREDFIDAPFLTNHDQDRIMLRLGNDVNKAKLAANIYLTLQGTPFLYYGEEIGMLGAKPDEQIREPFIWGEDSSYQTSWEPVKYNKKTPSLQEQMEDDNSLYNHYKEMIAIRNNNEALISGKFTALHSDRLEILAYQMSSDNQTLIIIHNLSDANQEIIIEELDGLKGRFIYGEDNLIDNNEIKPKSSIIIETPKG